MRVLQGVLSTLLLASLPAVMMGASVISKDSTPAPQTGGLTGSTLTWQYYDDGTTYGRLHQFVVGDGYDGVIGGVFHVQSTVYFGFLANDSSITFDFSNTTTFGPWSSSPLSLPPTIHNGLAVNVVSGPPIQAVTINPVTNMVGFNASRISFTTNQIQIDWQNLNFDTHTIVRLDVITGQ